MGLWLAAVVAWRPLDGCLDGCSYFLDASGCLSLGTMELRMPRAIPMTTRKMASDLQMPRHNLAHFLLCPIVPFQISPVPNFPLPPEMHWSSSAQAPLLVQPIRPHFPLLGPKQPPETKDPPLPAPPPTPSAPPQPLPCVHWRAPGAAHTTQMPAHLSRDTTWLSACGVGLYAIHITEHRRLRFSSHDIVDLGTHDGRVGLLAVGGQRHELLLAAENPKLGFIPCGAYFCRQRGRRRWRRRWRW